MSVLPSTSKRPAGLAFILVTVLIDVIGFGLVIPVLPNLVGHLAGGDHNHQVRVYGWLLAAYGLMQFVCAPVLGNLSDRFGRRPVLLLSLLFTGIDYVIQAVAPSIGWLFVGRIIAGVTGASFTAATAYIADVTPPEKRAHSFGMIGAAFGAGFIVGPAIGGLLGQLGPRVPFWAAAVASLLNVLYGAFVLPESLAKENRRAFTLNNANPLKSLGILRRKTWILLLAISAGLLWLAQQVPPSAWVLYTEYRFRWNPAQNGSSMALLGVCSIVIQFWLIRVLQRRFGDTGLVWISVAFNLIGFIAMGSAVSGPMMLSSMVVWSICFVGGPGLQSLLSHQFDATEQGGVQGALTSIQSLTGVIGPPIYTTVFGYFTGPSPIKVPGSPFYLGAVFTVVAAVMVGWALSHRPKESVEPSHVPEPDLQGA